MSFVPYSRYSRASQRPRHYAIVMIAKNGKSNDSSLTESLCAIATDTVVVSGAAYTSNVVVPRTNFKVTKGQPKDYDAKGDSGKINKHWFCSNCGSSLYTELEVMPDVTCVKSGGLDGGAANHPIAVEFYTKDRADYSKAVEGADQKPQFG
ncbi:hypothetical protein LTR09_002607 [Extremus antarcticus]|uniref:CENP-V/GFA domain-containing protein n=1 Tax=Extremus antarcticus TaxID=702011 RepID=A0AAJ0LVL8_9PEZI|nr:hypothetical protein LTR09_002607 [Extremus antarcticus]